MSFLNNSLLQWLSALGLTVAVFAALLFTRRAVRAYHQRLMKTARNEVLEIPVEVLSRTTLPFFVILALFAGGQALALNAKLVRIAETLITIALFWQAGVWLAAAFSGYLRRKQQRSLSGDRKLVGSLGIIGFIVNVAVWAMVLLLTLDNLGVDITALVAGLGIGGVAVALALQNILGDLFASLSIALDKPFVVGDFLQLDDVLGAVEHIGIKSTRIRSLSGEQISIPNGDLQKSRIRNYGRMGERRVVFATNIKYETPLDLVEKLPALIKSIVEAQPEVRFDRSHFIKHAAAALEFETVYFVKSADYNQYMDIQQTINLKLHREMNKLGIDFAYPTQRLVLANAAGIAFERPNEKHGNGQAIANPN